MIRPPLSNLGPMSQPWSDWVTDQTITNAEQIERLGGDASNDGRINNSTLDLLAGQINELYQRSAANVLIPNMQTPGFNESGAVVSTSQTVQLPRPTDAQRVGWMSFNSSPSVSPALTSSVFISLSIDGGVFYRSSLFLPVADSTPSGWNNMTFSGATGFNASPISGGSLTILYEAYGQAFGDVGFRTALLTGISATVAYGQKG